MTSDKLHEIRSCSSHKLQTSNPIDRSFLSSQLSGHFAFGFFFFVIRQKMKDEMKENRITTIEFSNSFFDILSFFRNSRITFFYKICFLQKFPHLFIFSHVWSDTGLNYERSKGKI